MVLPFFSPKKLRYNPAAIIFINRQTNSIIIIFTIIIFYPNINVAFLNVLSVFLKDPLFRLFRDRSQQLALCHDLGAELFVFTFSGPLGLLGSDIRKKSTA